MTGDTRAACHSCHGDATTTVPTGTPSVALAGTPNSGKSTLFNALTGHDRTVGNWPGTTVEVGNASWTLAGDEVELLDLPGCYSLDAHSPDEEVTRDVVLDRSDAGPAVVVVAVDAAHLARSLYLVAQLREISRRLVVALTMVDVARRRGIEVDPQALEDAVGVPVVALDPRRRTGLDALMGAVAAARDRPAPARRRSTAEGGDDEFAVAEERFAWVEEMTGRACTGAERLHLTRSDRVDRWATGRVTGPLVFLAVMWAVLQATTSVARPVQNALGALFSGPVTDAVTWVFARLGLADSWGQGFVVGGLINGVGMLLTFVPLMTLMFVLLALLEDSGYLARAAVVTDRGMRAIGLPGKAFLPLVVGFGCNVPAISATRILPDARQRLMTTLLVPFTSCSARLTVYVLVAATFFPRAAGTVVFAMYLVSILLVVLVGLLMRRTLWRTLGDEPLLLDLPPYQRPHVRVVGAITWMRVRGFLATAGGIIVATVTAVWLLQAIPLHGSAGFGHVAPEDSLFAGIARAIAPVFAPLGFGDWHTASALVVGFVAKEAVVTSWAQTYAAADPTTGQSPELLQQHIHAAFQASSGGAAGVAALAFLVFLLAYTPCLATVAAQLREVGRRWTAVGLAWQLATAWTLGAVVFQIGRLVT